MSFEEVDPIPNEVFKNPITTSLLYSPFDKYLEMGSYPSTFGKATVNPIANRTDKDQRVLLNFRRILHCYPALGYFTILSLKTD